MTTKLKIKCGAQRIKIFNQPLNFLLSCYFAPFLYLRRRGKMARLLQTGLDYFPLDTNVDDTIKYKFILL